MRRTIVSLVLCFLACEALGANAVLTSVTPNGGPTSGGITVTLHGTDLYVPCQTVCSSPVVLFGDVPATNVVVIDAATITAVAPAHAPGTVDVTYLTVLGGGPTLANAFTYHQERVLLPVMAKDSPGAFGSVWRTRFTVHNSSANDIALDPVDVCHIPECPPLLVHPGWVFDVDWNGQSSYVEIGRYFQFNSGDPNSLWMRLVAEDVTRLATTAGTEIPVVRESRFRQGRIRLVGVHASTVFRNRLRLYLDGDSETVAVRSYLVNAEDSTTQLAKEITVMPTRPKDENGQFLFWFLPAAEVQLEDQMFPQADADYVIEIQPTTDVPFWAFVSVTNNQTAHITTVTPQ